jgi:integrase
MTDRFKFTKRRLESLESGTKLTYCYDSEVRGLRLAVHPSGRRTFSLYRKFRRRPMTFPLGEFPHVTIDQARAEAAQKIAQLARGEDPRDTLRNAPATLGSFFERYVKEHLAGKPTAQHNARLTFDRYLKRWRSRPLTEVRRDDIERLHHEVSKPIVVEDAKTKRKRRAHGPVAANRLLALISSIFAKARDWNVFNGDNPARGVKKAQEHPRTRVLDRTGEFTRFREALNAEPDADLRLYLKLRLYNGVRERNIFQMRWDVIDLGRHVWQVGQTKNGDPLLVPLAGPVVDELLSRPRTSDWVFPGRRKGTHLNTLNKRWRAFRAGLELGDVQLRDLRRTFGSRALAAGVPMDVIAQIMGHRPGSKITASVYALADEQLKREAIKSTSQKMLTEAVE